MKTNALKIINKWIKTNEKLRTITKYLYEHTELFEMKYEDEFLEDLHAFFAGKITRCAKDYNTLINLLGDTNVQKIIELNLMEEE